MTIVWYCLVIMMASLAGGYLPLAQRVGHLKMQVYLSFAAGAMLGAAFFHMLPEAAEIAGKQFGLWTAIGVIGLYIIERFLSPHSHETPSEAIRQRARPPSAGTTIIMTTTRRRRASTRRRRWSPAGRPWRVCAFTRCSGASRWAAR